VFLAKNGETARPNQNIVTPNSETENNTSTAVLTVRRDNAVTKIGGHGCPPVVVATVLGGQWFDAAAEKDAEQAIIAPASGRRSAGGAARP
jgi:hypothetical protein